MKNQRGLSSLVVAAFIIVLALAVAGVGFWQQAEKNKELEQTNTNQAQVNTNTDLIQQACDNKVVYKMSSDAEQAQADCQNRGGTFNECDSTACGSVITVCKQTCTTTTNNANNKGTSSVVSHDLKHGFSASYPAGWSVNFEDDESVNIVKFGSPTHYISLQPSDWSGSENLVPGIALSTFTIDRRLSARDIANLIQNSQIAETISTGSDSCYSLLNDRDVSGFDVYAFKHDTVTDPAACQEDVTGPGLRETIVIKKDGQDDVLILNLYTYSLDEYSKYRAGISDIINTLGYEIS